MVPLAGRRIYAKQGWVRTAARHKNWGGGMYEYRNIVKPRVPILLFVPGSACISQAHGTSKHRALEVARPGSFVVVSNNSNWVRATRVPSPGKVFFAHGLSSKKLDGPLFFFPTPALPAKHFLLAQYPPNLSCAHIAFSVYCKRYPLCPLANAAPQNLDGGHQTETTEVPP